MTSLPSARKAPIRENFLALPWYLAPACGIYAISIFFPGQVLLQMRLVSAPDVQCQYVHGLLILRSAQDTWEMSSLPEQCS